MRKQLSASGVGRSKHCQYWLREDVTWFEQKPDSATNLGSAFHELAEKHAKHEKYSVEEIAERWSLSDRKHEELYQRFHSWLKWWSPYSQHQVVGLKYEMALAYNPETHKTRVLEPKGPRDYSGALPDEICMTADVVNLSATPPEVLDYKTGVWPVPPTSDQMKTLACAISAYTNESSVQSTILKVHNEASQALTAVLGPGELSEHRAHLKRLPMLVAAGPEPKPGDHCKFCPAMPACPAMVENLTAIVKQAPASETHLVSAHRFEPTIRSKEHAQWLLDAKAYIENMSAKVEDALKAYVDTHGELELPDGTVYGISYVQMEKPDLANPAAVNTLVAMGAASALKYEYRTSWEKIKEAVGKLKYSDIRAQLRDMGMTKVTTVKKYEKRKRTQKLGA